MRIRSMFAPLAVLAIATAAASARAATPPSVAPEPTAPAATASPAIPGAAPAVADLYRRMIALDAGVRTAQATIKVDVAFRSFPFVTTTLQGTSYYERPDRRAIVFKTVPALADAFRKVYPNLDPPATWAAKYRVSVLRDDGATTTFRLVPLRAARVAHLDVRADDAAATIVGYAWSYTDGGSIAFTQTFAEIGGAKLVSGQTGKIDLPSYRADVSSTFSDYRLNAPLPAGVFSGT